MDEVKCRECGAEMAAGATVCPRCGGNQEAAPATPGQKGRQFEEYLTLALKYLGVAWTYTASFLTMWTGRRKEKKDAKQAARDAEAASGVIKVSDYMQRVMYEGEKPIYKAKVHWLGFMNVIHFFFNELVVTEKRVIIKKGLLLRQISEMDLAKLETVDVWQGPIASMLNYGLIIFVGTGGSKKKFAGVADPMELRKVVLQYKEGS